MGNAASPRRDRDRRDVAAVELATPSESRPATPTKHPWQLAIASVLMLAWILFLAAMAWS